MTVAELQSSADALEETHTGRPTAPSKAVTKLERTQGTTLMEQLTETAGFVEGLANTKAAGDVALAASIITSVGFPLKKNAVKAPKGFKADSPAKGAAHVHLPAGEKGDVRLVRYSIDGQKTYSSPIVVHGYDLTITGIKSGTEIFFESAISTPPPKKSKATFVVGTDGLSWSDAVSCVVT